MLIVCPSCGTSYQIAPASLGAGRSVRCMRCRNVWFAANTTAISAIAEAHRTDLVGLKEPAAARPAPPLPAAFGPVEPNLPQAPPPDTAAAEPELAASESAPAVEPTQDETPPDSEPPALVADAPPLVPEAPDDIPPVPREDIESIAARHTRRVVRRRGRWPLTAWQNAILGLMLVITALISWRERVVQMAPQTASLYAAIRLPVNLRGLDFAGVETASESQDGVQVLVIGGAIVSTSAHRVSVPRLRFAVLDAGGHEIYAWTALPTKTALAPGEALAFRSRLASPPAESRAISVRFFNRHDRIAGAP